MQSLKKIGLVLGSGGIKGLAHIGVLKTFLEHQIPIDLICGSSIGAFMAVHYALYKDIQTLEKISLGMKKEKLYTFFEPTFKGGFVKGKKVTKLLELWFKEKTFSETKIPVSITATDLISGKNIVFSKGEIIPALQASMAVPTIFKPIEYQNKLLVDGGISNPVPDDIVKNMGADVVISINLDNAQKNNFSNTDLSLIKISARSLDIMRYYLAKECLKNSDIIIKPKISAQYASWKNYFTQENGQLLIDIGKKETEKQIIKIKQLLK